MLQTFTRKANKKIQLNSFHHNFTRTSRNFFIFILLATKSRRRIEKSLKREICKTALNWNQSRINLPHEKERKKESRIKKEEKKSKNE